MGNKALPEENFMQQEANIFLPLRWTWNLKGLPRVGKGGGKLPFMAFFLLRWCGSLFTAVLGYDACKSGKNL